jgi:hypothetical protein
MHKRENVFVRTKLHITSRLYVHFFKKNDFEIRLFKRQHVDMVGWHTLLSGLISIIDFDSLQIPNGCIRLC